MEPDIGLLEDLIRIPSVTADASAVTRAEERMDAYLREGGLHCTLETVGDRKVLYASTVEGKTPDVLLNAHLDVVPAPDGLFSPVTRDGLVYGRGSSDCKGSAVAIAQTLRSMVGRASVGAVFTADEETGGSTTAGMVALGYGAKKLIIVIDGGYQCLANGQKGILDLLLVAEGRAGHSSEPWSCDNAFDRLADGYAKLRAAWPAWTDDRWCDTFAATIVAAGHAHNQIPGRAEMNLNIRFTKPGDEDRIEAFVRETTGLETVRKSLSHPFFCDASHPSLQALLGAMERRWPTSKIELIRMNGATDARHFATLGVPIAILGVRGACCHMDGEWVDPVSIGETAEMLCSFLIDL